MFFKLDHRMGGWVRYAPLTPALSPKGRGRNPHHAAPSPSGGRVKVRDKKTAPYSPVPSGGRVKVRAKRPHATVPSPLRGEG